MSLHSNAALMHNAPAAAKAASLRYVSLDESGLGRKRSGDTFAFFDAKGNRLRDQATIERIRKLGIPPAWSNVWICATDNGHIQCTGFDVRGRKQYRYHARWRAVRDGAKYDEALRFGEALPKLRSKITHDISSETLTRESVIAAALRMMDRTHIRVGNERYTEENNSYGLTTLLTKHAKISGKTIELNFRGKSGKDRHAQVHDEKLAKILRRCREIPGQRLFHYRDSGGEVHSITSGCVNDYIAKATGGPFTAKEFRTWTATVGAARLLFDSEPSSSPTHGKKRVKAAIERIASELGNTHAICKKCYVHPAVVESYLSGDLHGRMRTALKKSERVKIVGMLREEHAVLWFLRMHSRAKPKSLGKMLEQSVSRLKKRKAA
ncbi:MAG: DNA topoisomerase IB [Polyangiaceae bacterium]